MPGFKGRGNTGGWGQCWKTVSHAMFAKRLGWVGEGVRTSCRERREAPGVESCASHVAATTAPTPPATERNPRQGPSRQPCPWLCSLRPCRASADPPELGRAGIGIWVSIFCGISAGRDAESDCPGAPSPSGRAQSRHVSRLLVQHSNQSDVIQADACGCRAHTGPQKAACPGERLCSEGLTSKHIQDPWGIQVVTITPGGLSHLEELRLGLQGARCTGSYSRQDGGGPEAAPGTILGSLPSRAAPCWLPDETSSG